MSKRIDPNTHNYRTTDHSEEIAALRGVADDDTDGMSDLNKAVLLAAADLLEVHDATGISLDNWFGPKELIAQALKMVYPDEDRFLENGV